MDKEISMLERVAMALHAINDARTTPAFRVTWDQSVPKYRDAIREEARAAIEAMRTPDAAMIVAGDEAWSSATGHQYSGVREAYDAMIDAALLPK